MLFKVGELGAPQELSDSFRTGIPMFSRFPDKSKKCYFIWLR